MKTVPRSRIILVGVLGALGLAFALMHSAQAVGTQPVTVAVINTVPTITPDLNSLIAVSTGATQVAVISSGRQSIYLQNESTATVCCSMVNTVVCPPTVGTTTGAAILKGSTALNDGTGGTLSLSQFSGALYCACSSGTCNVAALSFQR